MKGASAEARRRGIRRYGRSGRLGAQPWASELRCRDGWYKMKTPSGDGMTRDPTATHPIPLREERRRGVLSTRSSRPVRS